MVQSEMLPIMVSSQGRRIDTGVGTEIIRTREFNMKSPMPWVSLLMAAHMGIVFADNGIRAYRQGNYIQAAQDLKEFSGRDPIVDYYMGRMRLYGYGQLKNNILAIEHVKQAAEHGFLPAQQIMARFLLLEEKNPEQALFWFKKSADLNDVSAQMYCAAAYQFGVGVKANSDVAKRYYILAAKNGNSTAQWTLAQSFLETHQSANKKLGLIWLNKAVEQHNPEAQVMLGELYATGTLVPRDFVKAKEIVGQAVAQGYVPAFFQMGEIARLENDWQSAKSWYTKGAEAHDAHAEMALAQLYLQEKSPLYDLNTGFLWMLKAAQNGVQDAQMALSLMYKNGTGVTADENLAREWQAKAQQTLKTQSKDVEANAALWLTEGKTRLLSEAGFRLHGIFSAWSNAQALKNNHYNQAPQMEAVTREALFQPRFTIISANEIPISEYYNALLSSLGKMPEEALVFPRYPWPAEDKTRDLTTLQNQAVLGDSSAQYILAQLYQQGVNGQSNIDDAIKYYQLAAAQQDLRAEYNLALLYLESDAGHADYKKGLNLLQDAAFKGNTYAQYVLARIDEHGYQNASGQLVIPPDPTQVLSVYGLAAANNFGPAQYRLAEMMMRDDASHLSLIEKKQRNQTIKALYEGAVADGVSQAALPLAFFNAMDADPKKQQDALLVAKKAAESGQANAALLLGLMYDQGIAVDVSQDDAVHWYEKDVSNPIAAFLLGTHLCQGMGTAKDIAKGRALLQQAAAAGFSYAHHNLAILKQQNAEDFLPELNQAQALCNAKSGLLLADYYVLHTDDPKKILQARDIYQHLADQGEKEGQLKLAYMFEQGLGGQTDLARAEQWYGQAAAQNEPVAQYLLGRFYQLGEGLAMPDYVSAKKWYARAQSSYAPAAVALGFVYDTVDEDYSRALESYQIAANLHDAVGEFDLGLLYEYGKDRPVDREKAIEHYLHAAEHAHMQAMVQLAGLYLSSSSEQKQGLYWYKKAAELGDRDALYHLGLLSETGLVIKIDYLSALKYYQAASEKGQQQATLALARMYQYGQGVAQDLKQAEALYRQLSTLNNPYAQYQLALFYRDDKNTMHMAPEGIKLLQVAQSHGCLQAAQLLQKLSAQSQDGHSFVEAVPLGNMPELTEKPADLMYLDALNAWNSGDELLSRRMLAYILTEHPDYLPAKRADEQLSNRFISASASRS